MNEYRGETDAKRAARIMQLHTMLGWLGDAVDGGTADVELSDDAKALILAGDGGDARMLRGIGFPVADIVCVDRDATALERVGRLVPGMDLRDGDIRHVIASLPKDSVAIALLDFCGHANAAVRSSLQLVATRLQPTSYLSVTYLRGRETLNTPWLREARIAAQRFWSPTDPPIENRLRMESYRQMFSHLFAKSIRDERRDAEQSGVAHCHDIYQYNSGRSPMAVATVLLSPSRVPTNPRCIAVNDDCVLRWACGWLRRRFSTSQVADIVNKPAATVAAWYAHATRGTYGPRP